MSTIYDEDEDWDSSLPKRRGSGRTSNRTNGNGDYRDEVEEDQYSQPSSSTWRKTKRRRVTSDSLQDDEDDDYEASQQLARDALKAPQSFNMPFQALNEFVKTGVVNLDAPYQRDVVWNSAKQGHLIDSLVKNYYVPPVIFSIRPAENGEDIRVAIDGKQRLTSIHRFMEGEIPQIDSTNNDRVWYKKSRDCKSKRGRIMDRSERDEFNKKFQICVQYRGLNEEQEQEIFRRVQLGVALSTAERLFARPGPLADFARELVKTYDELLSIFDAKRKLGFQVLVQVILVIWYKPDKIPSAVNVDKEIKKGEPVDNKARVLVECVLDVFQTLVKEHSDVFQHPVRLAPIEFVMIAYLIAMRDEEPIEVLRDDVVVLRENTRKKFIDIRSNQRLYQFMKDHIDSLVMQ